MNKLQFQVGTAPTLDLRQTDHDIAIRGWDQQQIEFTLDGDPAQCTIEQQDNTLIVDSHVAMAVHLPRETIVRIGQVAGDLLVRDLDAQVTIEHVHGDASLRSGQAHASISQVHGDLATEDLDGPLSVGHVHGDVHLVRVQAVSLGQVHGDVHARTVDGALAMGAVSGDVHVRNVSGPLTLEEGSGSFRAEDLQAGMNVHGVHGDLSLNTMLSQGMTYRGRAQGSVMCRIPSESSARFTLKAEGEISAPLPQIETQQEGLTVGQIGEGEAQVELEAGGDLSIRVHGAEQDAATDWSFEGLAAHIEEEIARHMGDMDVNALVQQEMEKAMRRAEREIDKARERMEKEARRAEERAQRARERAIRAARKAQAKVAHQKWDVPLDTGPFVFGKTPSPPEPKISEAEQLAILKMLQENKISVEQAEMLLKALEG
jgi:hypothetical protein